MSRKTARSPVSARSRQTPRTPVRPDLRDLTITNLLRRKAGLPPVEAPPVTQAWDPNDPFEAPLPLFDAAPKEQP